MDWNQAKIEILQRQESGTEFPRDRQKKKKKFHKYASEGGETVKPSQMN